MNLTYESVTAITQHPAILIVLIISWGISWLTFISFGIFRRKKSTRGKVYGKSMASHSGWWIIFTIWTILYPILVIFGIIFPFWLKLFT